MKKILLVVIVSLIFGCASEAEIQHMKERSLIYQKSIDACINQGGVPIISGWGPWMKDCKFNK